MLEVDLCIVGGDEGGVVAASAGVALGLSVALVTAEAGADVPVRTDLVIAHFHREAKRWHAVANGPAFDLVASRRSLDAVLRAAAPDRRLARLAAMNVRVIHGRGRFVDARTLEAGAETVRARRFVLAVGTNYVVAPDGVPADRFITPDTLGDLRSLPAHLMVLGGDGVAVSVAQSMRRFGSAVTLVAPEGLLPDLDPELAAPLRRQLQADGVVLEPGGRPVVRGDATGLVATWPDTRQVAVSHLFLSEAHGWQRSDLGLANAGIGTGRDGFVLSPSLRTANPRVYALTAVSPQAAQAQVAVIMKAAFFRVPLRYRPERIPICTATDPQIATVGFSEAEARKVGAVSIWRWPLAETDEARLHRDPIGHIKVVADRHGRVLGAGIVGGDAGGQIGFWSLALATDMTLSRLADVPLPGPSWSEATRRAVMLHAAGRLQSRWVKRALAILNRLSV